MEQLLRNVGQAGVGKRIETHHKSFTLGTSPGLGLFVLDVSYSL